VGVLSSWGVAQTKAVFFLSIPTVVLLKVARITRFVVDKKVVGEGEERKTTGEGDGALFI